VATLKISVDKRHETGGDSRNVITLMPLDLSAVFIMVDHTKTFFGCQGG
jgi:hypothetical protein